LALAAGFAAVVAATTLALSGEQRVTAPTTASAGSDVTGKNGRQVVHFAIVAPRAGAVTLVGDFNAWDTKTTPMAKGAVDGLWIVTVPLAAGSYQYAFVVDDTTWMADPAAPIALEDEFGTPSSVLTIEGGRT
jgi:1,4-alpha-glucan branching enzyme